MADIDASQRTQCSNFYIPTLLAFVCGFCHYIDNMATDTPDTVSISGGNMEKVKKSHARYIVHFLNQENNSFPEGPYPGDFHLHLTGQDS